MRIPPSVAARRKRMARDQQRRTGRTWVPQPERMSRTERRMTAFSAAKGGAGPAGRRQPVSRGGRGLFRSRTGRRRSSAGRRRSPGRQPAADVRSRRGWHVMTHGWRRRSGRVRCRRSRISRRAPPADCGITRGSARMSKKWACLQCARPMKKKGRFCGPCKRNRPRAVKATTAHLTKAFGAAPKPVRAEAPRPRRAPSGPRAAGVRRRPGVVGPGCAGGRQGGGERAAPVPGSGGNPGGPDDRQGRGREDDPRGMAGRVGL